MGRRLLLSTSAVLSLWSAAAHAQAPASSADATLSELVVTAERRTSNLQTTPVAAAVLSGEDLQRKAVTSLDQLQFAMPSVTVQNFGQGNSFNVRGIGKSESNSSTGVGVITYRDGVATFPGYFQTEPYYDIASLELLRGPQGTFAGQNATGGAVFITEKNPDLSSVNGYVQAQLGNYDDRRLQGALNAPLGETLAVRMAFNTERRDSFFDITGPYSGKPGRLKSYSGRFSLLWAPTDALKVLLKTDLNSIDMGGYPAGLALSAGSRFDLTSNAPHAAKDKFTRTVLNISYELDNGITLKSITGYQDGNTRFAGDVDGTSALSNTFRDDVDERIWSQEVNIISPDAGPLTWVVGAYHQDDKATFPPGKFVTTTPPLFQTLEGVNPKKTSAVFGQVSYAFNDRLQLQVGARWSKSSSRNNAILAIPLLGLRLTQNDEASDKKVTGKVALNFKADENNFLYAFVATGHKAGGLNAPNLAIPPRAFAPENVTDFEAGWKSTLFDGHLRTQVGGYYNIYKDFQVTIGDPVVPSISSILNVTGDTKVYGVEASAQAVFGALAFDVGASVSRSSLGDFFAADPRIPRTGPCNAETGPVTATCLDLGGNEQTYSPELTLNLGVQYAIDLGAGTLTPRIDYSHVGRVWTTLFENRGRGDRLGPRDIVNAQLSYRQGDWDLTAYATNLGDLEYTSAINASLRYAGPPRQYGVRLTREF